LSYAGSDYSRTSLARRPAGTSVLRDKISAPAQMRAPVPAHPADPGRITISLLGITGRSTLRGRSDMPV